MFGRPKKDLVLVQHLQKHAVVLAQRLEGRREVELNGCLDRGAHWDAGPVQRKPDDPYRLGEGGAADRRYQRRQHRHGIDRDHAQDTLAHAGGVYSVRRSDATRQDALRYGDPVRALVHSGRHVPRALTLRW